MKFLTMCLFVAAICNNSSALPARKRVTFYQPAAKWISAPQNMMFMRYVQPAGTHARSTQAAALGADEGVEQSTILKNGDGSILLEAPQNFPIDANVNEGQASGTEYEAAIPDAAIPDTGAVPADKTAVPEIAVIPAKRFSPVDTDNNNRVFIELEPPTENEIPLGEKETDVVVPQDAINDEDDEIPIVQLPKFPARVPSVPRPIARKPSKAPAQKPLPLGTFFPVDFGGVNGGAVAIAHSLSTDAGGSATSNAIAYGTPSAVETARLRRRY